MKKQNGYFDICKDLNKRAKANIKLFLNWVGNTEELQAEGLNGKELEKKFSLFVDKLTNPRNVEAFFEREHLERKFLYFLPFLLTEKDGAEMFLKTKTHKNPKGGK